VSKRRETTMLSSGAFGSGESKGGRRRVRQVLIRSWRCGLHGACMQIWKDKKKIERDGMHSPAVEEK
jgi:hypothetical protein